MLIHCDMEESLAFVRPFNGALRLHHSLCAGQYIHLNSSHPAITKEQVPSA